MLLKGFFVVVVVVVFLEIAKDSKIFDFYSQFAALLFLSSFIVLGFAGAKTFAPFILLRYHLLESI